MPDFGLQDDDGGVDVAGLADGGIDERRAEGGDGDRLLAEHEARHVEIVDHHVAEQAAGARDIGDRRRRGIARGDLHQFDRADRALADAAAQDWRNSGRSGG